jgi:hypothetical protein
VSWFQRDDGEEPWLKVVKETHTATKPDAAEMSSVRPQTSEPNDVSGLTVTFNYLDAEGEPTRRTVNCHRVWHGENSTYVRGLCKLRNEERTFRTERIANLVVNRTGKKIADPVVYFDQLADQSPPSRPKRTAQEVSTTAWAPAPVDVVRQWHMSHQARRFCIDGLRVLAYVTLSGDGWNDADKNVEESYIESRIAMAGLVRSQQVTDAIMEVGAGLAVPFSSFIRSINLIAADQPHFDLVKECVQEIFGNDGSWNSLQQEAYHRLMAAGLSVARVQ